MPPCSARSRRATTLPELLIVLGLLGLVAAFAVRAGVPLLDAARVRSAADELRSAYATARELAALRSERAAVRIASATGTVVVHLRTDTALRRPLGALYGVRLTPSRDSMAYAASGLGWGAANLQVVVARGAAAETVAVSRLGRVR
jgi:prepilin-type N-terminal cleavage/methylation domain-containing protein